jgi:hypothetical protein
MSLKQEDFPLVLFAYGNLIGAKGKCWLCKSESEGMTADIWLKTDRGAICKSCETAFLRLSERVGPQMRFLVKESK